MLSRLARVVALLRNPKVGKLPRVAVLLAVGYLLWPMDLVPDWIVPVVGWFDDLTLIWLALRWLLKSGSATPPPPTTLARPDAPA